MKVPYPILALEVEKLYAREFNDDQLKEIDEHCKFIAEFIKACGYSEEEYMERWMKEPGN